MHLRMDGKRDCSCPHACPPLRVFSYLWQLGGRCFPWGKTKWRKIKELSMHTELAGGVWEAPTSSSHQGWRAGVPVLHRCDFVSAAGLNVLGSGCGIKLFCTQV